MIESPFKIMFPKAYQEFLTREMTAARDTQAAKLAKFVQAGYVSLEQIACTPCRQLREATTRFSIDDYDEIYFIDKEIGHLASRLKFMTIMGLLPQEDHDLISPEVASATSLEIIDRYAEFCDTNAYLDKHKRKKRSKIVAVLFGGSRFNAGKTPGRHSDFDIDIVYEDGGFIDVDDIVSRFQTGLERGIDVTYSSIKRYKDQMMLNIERENRIAAPYRQSNLYTGLKYLPYACAGSLLVAQPNYFGELDELLELMPPHMSEQPFRNIYERPAPEELANMNLNTSSEWYAHAVERVLSHGSD